MLRESKAHTKERLIDAILVNPAAHTHALRSLNLYLWDKYKLGINASLALPVYLETLLVSHLSQNVFLKDDYPHYGLWVQPWSSSRRIR